MHRKRRMMQLQMNRKYMMRKRLMLMMRTKRMEMKRVLKILIAVLMLLNELLYFQNLFCGHSPEFVYT